MDAYRGKPVYMVEGNALWRGCWAKDEADRTATRAAWAVTLAGGSFAWQDAAACFNGPIADILNWPTDDLIANRLDVLYRTMGRDVAFEHLTPTNELLGGCWASFDLDGPVPSSPCFAAAEIGVQYVVCKEDGGAFELAIATGTYDATWIDTHTGTHEPVGGGTIAGGSSIQFIAPTNSSDWVLLLRNAS
jgi:hypothetical protein